MSLYTDFVALARPWLDNPVRRAEYEFRCLRLALIFHDENNRFRKLTMLVLLGVWAALTLGLTPPGGSVPAWLYTALTAFVFAIVGRQWGVEVRGLPFEMNDETDSDD